MGEFLSTTGGLSPKERRKFRTDRAKHLREQEEKDARARIKKITDDARADSEARKKKLAEDRAACHARVKEAKERADAAYKAAVEGPKEEAEEAKAKLFLAKEAAKEHRRITKAEARAVCKLESKHGKEEAAAAKKAADDRKKEERKLQRIDRLRKRHVKDREKERKASITTQQRNEQREYDKIADVPDDLRDVFRAFGWHKKSAQGNATVAERFMEWAESEAGQNEIQIHRQKKADQDVKRMAREYEAEQAAYFAQQAPPGGRRKLKQTSMTSEYGAALVDEGGRQQTIKPAKKRAKRAPSFEAMGEEQARTLGRKAKRHENDLAYVPF